MELLYYFIVSKANITVSNLNIFPSTLTLAVEYTNNSPLSYAAKHFCVESAEYVCKLLNQIYLNQRAQHNLKPIMTIS